MTEPGGIDYEGRVFASVANTENGDVGDETIFHYHQHGDLVWADHAGGRPAGGAAGIQRSKKQERDNRLPKG
jgi:hypothetical protein